MTNSPLDSTTQNNTPQDPDQTAPMERVHWSEAATPEKKGKKPFTSRKLTLILGAVVFFLIGTVSGIGINIAFGNAGGDSSQTSGGPGGAGQMQGGPGQMPGGNASAGSGSGGNGSGSGSGTGSGGGSGSSNG